MTRRVSWLPIRIGEAVTGQEIGVVEIVFGRLARCLLRGVRINSHL